MRELQTLFLICALLLVIVACGELFPPKDMDAVIAARDAGDYSYCNNAREYWQQCIAETELGLRPLVQFDCCSPDACAAPSCFQWEQPYACGPACDAVRKNCAVNPAWLCEQTGGVLLKGANSTSAAGLRFMPPGYCQCPAGNVYLQNYGCANCSAFEHEETVEHCRREEEGNITGILIDGSWCRS